MITVAQSAVDDAWNELYNSSEERAQELVEEFAHEQPHLAGFLVNAEEEISKLDDRGFLLLYGTWAWLAFKLEGRDDSTVTRGMIDASYERNTADRMRLEGITDSAMLEAARDFTAGYRHFPLLGAIINDVLEGEMESGRRDDDISGMLVVIVKTVIDCLDA